MRVDSPFHNTGRSLGDRPFWTRHLYREVQIALDLVVLVASFAFAYLLRFDFQIPPAELHRALIQLPFVVLLQLVVVFLSGIYSFIWRYVSMHELGTFLRGAIYSGAPILALRLTLPTAYHAWRVPISIIVMDTVLAFGGLLALRVFRRALYENYERAIHGDPPDEESTQRVLLVGAGRAGVMAAREITGRRDSQLRAIGFVDDDAKKQSTVIHGLRVLGTTRDIPRLSRQHNIDQVIITIASADSSTIRGIVEICEKASIRVRIIPNIAEILSGQVSISRFRDVQIEDLLGREPVELDHAEIGRFLTEKRIMVTGSGGSIGAELCRQIARFNPLSLLLVERAEHALFEIDRELRQQYSDLRIVPLIADVSDEARMRHIFEIHRPHVVLHAAAHKHVVMMEDNPAEAIKNNVLATDMVARLAGLSEAEAFVLISTDKAVRPVSVMGATKRMAELVAQYHDHIHPKTRYVAVRFGNVMGSAGSVVPIFKEQIRQGGPVTVTHPEARRYFMTIPEAAQLVLQAGALGGMGEIMILDMGDQISVLALAKDMITLSGFKPFEDIPIVYTGLRAGEKLSEELVLTDEEVRSTPHPKIFVGKIVNYPQDFIEAALADLRAVAARGERREVREALDRLLPEAQLERNPVTFYTPPERVVTH